MDVGASVTVTEQTNSHSHKPLTQVVHQTYGGAETRAYQCLNLHAWKI